MPLILPQIQHGPRTEGVLVEAVELIHRVSLLPARTSEWSTQVADELCVLPSTPGLIILPRGDISRGWITVAAEATGLSCALQGFGTDKPKHGL